MSNQLIAGVILVLVCYLLFNLEIFDSINLSASGVGFKLKHKKESNQASVNITGLDSRGYTTESGSNSDGEYLHFSNGLKLCQSSGYTSGENLNFSFPHAFSNTPNVFLGGDLANSTPEEITKEGFKISNPYYDFEKKIYYEYLAIGQ